MDYSNFINEDIYITYGNVYVHNTATLNLAEVLAPNFEDYHETRLIFQSEKGSVTVYESEILQFLPIRWLNNENHEYFYVIFRYGKTSRSKEHIYMSNDHTIKTGDMILTCCDEHAGNVIETGFFKKMDAPYPPEKTWLIKRQAHEEPLAEECKEHLELIRDGNYYLGFLNGRKTKGYIAPATETYASFSEGYIESVDQIYSGVDRTEITSDGILAYCEEDFTGGYPRMDTPGDYCRRYNQLYNFFDSVWLCYVLAKYGVHEEFFVDMFYYLLVIYKNGGYDKYLYNAEFDKKCIDEHIDFILKYFSKNNI